MRPSFFKNIMKQNVIYHFISPEPQYLAPQTHANLSIFHTISLILSQINVANKYFTSQLL